MRYYRVWLQTMAERDDEEMRSFSLYCKAKSMEHLYECLEEGRGDCGLTENDRPCRIFGVKPVSVDEYETGRVLDFKRKYIRENCSV